MNVDDDVVLSTNIFPVTPSVPAGVVVPMPTLPKYALVDDAYVLEISVDEALVNV